MTPALFIQIISLSDVNSVTSALFIQLLSPADVTTLTSALLIDFLYFWRSLFSIRAILVKFELYFHFLITKSPAKFH